MALGRISLGCVVAAPLSYFVFYVFAIIPLLAVAFLAGAAATILSKGRSVPGLIGLAISGSFAMAIVWMVITRR
jgi:hypothetical protein